MSSLSFLDRCAGLLVVDMLSYIIWEHLSLRLASAKVNAFISELDKCTTLYCGINTDKKSMGIAGRYRQMPEPTPAAANQIKSDAVTNMRAAWFVNILSTQL